MASNAYLRLKGVKQGDIKGSVTLAGREGTILVVAAEHEIVSPTDAASGLPTGKVQHKPFILVKEVDRASPQMMTLLLNNELLSVFKLEFWRASGTLNVEKLFYTVSLTNARIGAIKLEKLNTAYPENDAIHERERVAVYYDTITWTSADSGTSASGSWSTPVF